MLAMLPRHSLYPEPIMSALRYGLVGLFFVTASADAQSYTGTYVTPNATGANVTLVLEQDARGNVTGSLSGTGVTYAVQGLIEEGTVLGTLSSVAGGVYFAAEHDGSGLVLTLFEADANNQPDYSRGETLQFTRVGHAAAPSSNRTRWRPSHRRSRLPHGAPGPTFRHGHPQASQRQPDATIWTAGTSATRCRQAGRCRLRSWGASPSSPR